MNTERIKPVQVNEIYEVDIKKNEFHPERDPVAVIEGFIIFVKEGNPGAKAQIQIEKVMDKFAVASVVRQL